MATEHSHPDELKRRRIRSFTSQITKKTGGREWSNRHVARCKGHLRHWFTERGIVGGHLPNCVRCGVPNPRYKADPV